ncbi:hypothetical protein, partial [Streptomyces clavuligerus]|uniref:hypothetical protein n=1 Tax=Streptomyces clavuligerus TaxID=1901 RepID=UPI0027BADA98
MVLTMLPGAVEQGHRVLEAVQDGGGGAAVVAGVGVAGGLGGEDGRLVGAPVVRVPGHLAQSVVPDDDVRLEL